MISYKPLVRILPIYNVGAVGIKDELIKLDFEVRRSRFKAITLCYKHPICCSISKSERPKKKQIFSFFDAL